MSIVPVDEVNICELPFRERPPPNFPLAVYCAPLFATNGVPPVVLCPIAFASSKFQYATNPVVTSTEGTAAADELVNATKDDATSSENAGIIRRIEIAHDFGAVVMGKF